MTQHIQTINNFAVQKKLSSSKYSVYKAINTKENNQVALKVFPSKSEHSPISFLRETRIFSKLSHPNIIKLYESVDSCLINLNQITESASYIAMEFAKYGDLFDIISQGGYMSEALARTLFKQLVEGLSYLHSQNIAHLDLKIENLLIDEDFNLKITDFDLAQSITGESRLEGRGTPGYRAPEVRDGTCKNFVAADIYSLGVILFVMLSGNPPYSEVDKGLGHEFDPFYRLMRKNNEKFWEIHSKYKPTKNFYSEEAKNLINWILCEDPNARPTLEEIKSDPWFNGETLSKEDFKNEMTRYLKKAKKL